MVVPNGTKSADPNIVESAIDPEFRLPNIPYAKFLSQKISSWNPETIALIDPFTDTKVTYSELHRKCQELASSLIQLGVTKQDVVSIFADNSIDLAVSMITTIYLGLTFGPVSPFSRKYDFAGTVSGCRGTVLIVGANKLPILEQAFDDPELVKTFSKIHLVVELGSSKPDPLLWNHEVMLGKVIVTLEQALVLGAGCSLKQIPYFEVPKPEVEHFFYVSTSGTTGPPKRVIQSHRSFMAMTNGGIWPDHEGWKFTSWPPMGQSSGVVTMNIVLCSGMTGVVFPSNNLEVMLPAVEKYRIDIILCSPDLGILLAENEYQKKYDLSSVTEILYGGSKFADHILDALMGKYGVQLRNSYGSMECFGHMCFGPGEMREKFQYGACGRVGPGMQMKIVDLNTGKSLPANSQGEVLFRGPQVFLGYLDNPEATASTIDSDGWYHSGDLGFYDTTGTLFVNERIKEMIKFKLFSLIPAEIEDFLLKHPAVMASVVVGVAHPVDINWIRAYVLLEKGKSASEQELIDYVADNLGSQKRLLAGVKFVTEMPRSPVGKITRSYFKNLVKDELIRV